MDLKEFLNNKSRLDDYNLKMVRYNFDYRMLNQTLNAEIAKIEEAYQKSFAILEAKARLDCGEKPNCNHDIVVEFSMHKQYEYEPVYYCLACKEAISYDVVREAVVKVQRPVENIEEAKTILSRLEEELTKLSYSGKLLSLNEVAIYLTDFINISEEKVKR